MWPEVWKNGFVVEIFKKGCMRNFDNWRGLIGGLIRVTVLLSSTVIDD